ncbi:hypothetical protein [Polyangium mundeleinium]|uniref:Uncharacterized protein n=1 Tax=Polyangium mundeleinium TaxID=2995306 RepID=A0ABT5EIW4_9BACT|nr:hypothetical protein [Polyangium mundeleinium]MDC0741763.1 hypothetical protein [Polyangium mundeleinium]
MNLQPVDALPWVRARPQQFFPLGKLEPIYLLAYLMADVLELGRGSCTIRQRDGWWIIGSEIDWLHDARHSETELFERVVAAPQHGEHSMRGEVLLSAFARSVWIALDGRRVCIQGEEPPPGAWDQAVDLHRAIVFAM